MRYATSLTGDQFIIGNFGSFEEHVATVAFDGDGSLIVTGTTKTFGFPTTEGAVQREDSVCCVSRPALGFFSRIDGESGQLLASTLVGGEAAKVTGFVMDQASRGVWLVGEQDPFVLLISNDATALLLSWRLPRGTASNYVVAIQGGFVGLGVNHVSRYEWDASGAPRALGIANAGSGAITRGTVPGEVLDVYGSGFSMQTRIFFDGILAPRLRAAPRRLRVIVPFGVSPNANIEMTLVEHDLGSWLGDHGIC